MTPRALLLLSARRLREAGVPDPDQDAAWMLSFLTGQPPLLLRLDTETLLDEDTLSAFDALLQRRKRREPLQYLLGSVSFHGLTFRTDPRALIPRPETSLLADWCLECLEHISSPVVLDLCCGSGCIGLSLKAARSDLVLTMTDLSADALSLAMENAQTLQLDAAFLQGDLFAPLSGAAFELIVSNPPYIPSRDCETLQEEVRREPLLALDGGGDGLDFYRRIAAEAPGYLRPGGQLLMELGDGEAQAVEELLHRGGAVRTERRADLAGLDRMIRAVY